MPERLSQSEIESVAQAWPEEVRRLALAARALVLDVAPQLAEKVAFGALCYYKPGMPFGVIGGNVCLVAEKRRGLRLAFLHGASLPDPEHLLQGKAKAKRELEILARDDLRRAAVADLIRAAVAHDPSGGTSAPHG